MIVSQIGRALIERNEGLRLDAYQDSVGVWTIGYGDTGPDVVEGLTITKEEADRRLSNRLANEFGAAVNRAIGSAPTTQPQFDAMVSLCYNIGTGAFGGSTVIRRHVERDYPAAAAAFLLWTKAGGVVLAGLARRREEERALYLSDAATLPIDKAAPVLAAVKALQLALRAYGYAGQIDGDWGDQTDKAWAEYQNQTG